MKSSTVAELIIAIEALDKVRGLNVYAEMWHQHYVYLRADEVNKTAYAYALQFAWHPKKTTAVQP